MAPKEKGFMENPKEFLGTLATKLPYVKLIIRENDQMCHVKWKVCIEVEHKDKILVLKLDGRHNGRRKYKWPRLQTFYHYKVNYFNYFFSYLGCDNL